MADPGTQVLDRVAPDLEQNVRFVDDALGIGTSWDIVRKPFSFGGLRMTSYVLNGYFMTIHVLVLLQNVEQLVKDYVAEHSTGPVDMCDLVQYLNTRIPFVQVQTLTDMHQVLHFILSGPMVTFIDGCDQALLVDTRVYPMRSISPPQIERVVRGPHDSFTETMLLNVAMIRRRLRDPRLRVELMQIGSRSQTDVSLLYIEDVTNPDLVKRIREKLKAIQADTVAMGEQAIVEHISRIRWNPYPLARYTERPDVAATALIEGQVVIIVDTSPEAIIAPTTFFQHLQHPQEYHSNPLLGTYLRWIILIAVFASIFLPGVFLLFNAHPEWIPPRLAFFKADRSDPLPLWTELVLVEFALDVMRLAVINTPVSLASSVSIVSALLFGQFASAIHLLQPEVLVYMGFVMIAQFATSSYELGEANQMARFWVIGWTAALGWPGLVIAALGWFIYLGCTRSFGVPYLWPLWPLTWRNGLREVLIRAPMYRITGRPVMLHPKTSHRKGS